MEIWDLYDKNGNLLRKKVRRNETINPGEYHLVCHIWIYNDAGQYLIQKRNKPDGLMHNFWACTGGCVISGETSLDGAIRETQEEMGILLSGFDLQFIERSVGGKYIQDMWITRWNGPIEEVNFDPVEVQDVRWVSRTELEEMLDQGEFWNYDELYFSLVYQNSISVSNV